MAIRGVAAGRPDGSKKITGSQNEVVEQTETGAQRNDNYANGGSINVTSYPTTIDPDETIYEVTIFSAPPTQTLDLALTEGGTLSGVSPEATSFVISSLKIDSVTFNDDGESEACRGFWAGE